VVWRNSRANCARALLARFSRHALVTIDRRARGVPGTNMSGAETLVSEQV